MKILFSTFGSLGDIHPYIAIALEAKKRGHEPILATAPKYRAKIEQLGLGFRPIRPDLPPKEEFGELAKRVMDLKDGPRYLFEDILIPSLRDSYADLLEAAEDVDVIITHPAALAGPVVAQKLEKKWMSSVLAPISLWSKSDPPVPPTLPQLDFLRALGPLWSAVFINMGKLGTRKWIAGVEKLREDVGLPKGHHPMFEGQFSPYGTLALFSPNFAAPQKDWPTNTTATGFCFYDAEGYEGENNNIPQLKEFPPSEDEFFKKPLIFTLGSSAVYGAGDFWEQSLQVVETFKEVGARGIFLTGGKWRDKTNSPYIQVIDYAPHSQIFPMGDVVIHQGGAGTTAQALRAGVRQIVLPFAHDQPDNARRLKKLGVALSCPIKNFRDEKAYEMIFSTGKVINREYVSKLGEIIQQENGPLRACEAIEQIGPN